MASAFEDKKCRLCGHADMENEHIFNTRDRYLVKKIAAVFSIWVTPTDPLPKSICSKCFEKVSSTYKNYTKVKKHQTKWLENVASREPNNNYMQVLNFIEHANKSIKNFIETNYREKLSKNVIENLLISALSGMDESRAEEAVLPNIDENDKLANGALDTYEISTIKTEAPAEDPHGDDDDDYEENLSLAEIAANKKMKLSPIFQQPIETKCKYCALKFESLKELAVHQVSHMKLSIPRLFAPKDLDKDSRRGRLISVETRQSIRCLNCYLVFDDNKCILEHWSNAECDFYCQICGAEFAHSPKMLRDHVTEAHGISYRSLKMQRDLSFLSMPSQQLLFNKPKQRTDAKSNKQKISSPKIEANKIPIQNDALSPAAMVRLLPKRRIKCRVCKRDFRNFKACNSHMRAHKPTYAFNDTEQLANLFAEAHVAPELMSYESAPPPLTPKPAIMALQLYTTSTSTNTNTESDIRVAENDDTINIPQPAIDDAEAANNDDYMKTTTPVETSSANAMILESPLLIKTEITEPTNMELEKIQAHPSTTSCNNFNNVTNFNSNVMAKLASSSPNISKVATSTAPRGIRMKFVNRRSDLNSSNPAIKVKSINDLKALQSLAACNPPLAAPKDLTPIFNVPTCPPQLISINELKPNQSTNACFPSSYTCYDTLKSIQNIAACAATTPLPPLQHAYVKLNSSQNQLASIFNSFQLPRCQNPVMSTAIRDEPMEFIQSFFN